MKYLGLCLLYFTTLLFSGTLWAQGDPYIPLQVKTHFGEENLVIVQSISSSRRSFIIARGAKDGISTNQLALFSTEKVSLLCRAVEVAHDHSLWKVDEPMASVPFQKRQFVVYTSSLETIWTKIPSLKDVLQKQIRIALSKPKPYWILRGGITMGMYESTSETDPESTKRRSGQQFELLWNFNFSKNLDWGLGGRIDNEKALLSEEDLVVETRRIFAISELTYTFPPIGGTKNYFYMTATVGLGTSSTSVNENTSTGTAGVLPAFHIGLATNTSENNFFMIESVIEAISMQEEFQDGTQQNTNIVNAKLSLGYRW